MVCVKQGEMLPIFPRIVGAMMSIFFLHPFDVNNCWGRILGKEFLGKNFWRILFGLCVKQGEMLPIFLRIVGAMMSNLFCTHSMSIVVGKAFLGKTFWEILLGEEFLGRHCGEEFLGKGFWGIIFGLCVKQGEMLPMFLRIVGAMMSGILCTHSTSIIFGEEFLGACM